MANLLSTATSVANAVTAVNNIDVSGSSLTNAGVNAALSAATAITAGQNPLSAAASSALGSIPGASTIASAASSVFGGSIGGLSGTKPQALHTEYAAGGADWAKPYGAGTDIVFYLMRADGGGGGGAGNPTMAGDAGGAPGSMGSGGTGLGVTGADASGNSGAKVPADVTAGEGFSDGMQSPLNQVASAANLTGVMGTNVGATVPSLVGPLTGLTEGLSTATSSVTSATAALTNSTSAAVFNAVGAASSSTNLSNTQVRSIAASESFFNETLSTTFGVVADPTSGLVGLSEPPVSEFSQSMAKMTGGVTSTDAFIKGINNGSFGFTSTSSQAEMSRTSSTGKPRKS